MPSSSLLYHAELKYFEIAFKVWFFVTLKLILGFTPFFFKTSRDLLIIDSDKNMLQNQYYT